MTVRELIAGSLRLLQAYGGGDTPETEDLNDGLTALNELLNNWNAQYLTIYTIVSRLLPLTAGTQTYTIGTTGTWAYPRPVKVESAFIVQPNGLRSDLKMDTSLEWAAIPEKAASGRLPLRVYIDHDYPLSAVSVWPVPNQDCNIELNVWNELTDALQLDDPFDLPPSYGRAVRFNLAVTLSSEYGKGQNLDPTVARIADQSKAELFGLNASQFANTQAPPNAA